MSTVTLSRTMMLDEVVTQQDGNSRRLPQVVATNPHLMRLPLQLPAGTIVTMPEQESSVNNRIQLWGKE
ncbi:MAG: phage tail protein [Gammaproteobacteria bacterium]|nr:MAG: phage tail protein [Gammaproteobacteria bacterium]